MSGITPVFGWTYPILLPETPEGMGQLALAIEATVAAITARYAKGIVAAPVSTTANGTATAADTVEVRDAVLGNYVFTGETGRRYKVTCTGLWANSSSADIRYMARIRDGGASTPTTSSTLIAEDQTWVGETLSAGRKALTVSHTFTVASSGTRTLSLFTVSPDSAVLTPTAASVGRELYVEDCGPA